MGSPRLAAPSSPRLAAPSSPWLVAAEPLGDFSAGDYCDEIPAHLLYAEEPAAVVDVPPVAAPEKVDPEKEEDEIDEPDD